MALALPHDLNLRHRALELAANNLAAFDVVVAAHPSISEVGVVSLRGIPSIEIMKRLSNVQKIMMPNECL
jgi:hypothetical protein